MEATEEYAFEPCPVCSAGAQDPMSRNRRCNVSALVRCGDASVLVDCGKTAREACMRHLPSLGVRTIDAVVLTHGHADAILGLDDLRDIQSGEGLSGASMPVFASEKTLRDVSSTFSYLIPKQEVDDVDEGVASDIPRRVAKIDWKTFNVDFEPFCPVEGIEFTPFPLYHGGTYICAGFLIRGAFASTVAYLSDVNEVPEETMDFLEKLPAIDLLIVDALHPSKPYKSHFALPQAIELALRLRPRVTRCVGMSCSFGDHDSANENLKMSVLSEGLDIQLGFDGEQIQL
jgi:phosphoribosyl 1,2-cyclic phosphodiesterase